ncbi:MAG TPA: hypothetical protein DCM14_04035 [Clostridiales bacterium UBA8153]|nr:hypothetical protein [Clostridiales bacterium UBA8153]
MDRTLRAGENARVTDLERLVQELAERPGVVVVLGATDTGKSTLVLELARRLHGSGVNPAVVDTDTGQSDLGPPGVIAMARTGGQVAGWSEVRPEAQFFVGATSPPGLEAFFLAGCWRMVEAAHRLGVQAVVVNTTGLVHGSRGRYLNQALLEGLRPRHLVAIQRAQELEHLLSACPYPVGIWRLTVRPEVQIKDREKRRAAREAGYRRALRGATLRVLDLTQVKCLRTRYRTGVPLDPAARDELEVQLGVSIAYAEQAADGTWAVLPGEVPYRPWADTERVHAVALENFSQLQVGLLDDGGELAGIGVLESLDLSTGTATVFTPVGQEVGGLVFGTTRLSREGRELGRLRPDDV